MKEFTELKYVSKLLSVILDFFITFSFLIRFLYFLRHIKELAEHYIIGEKLFWKNEKEKEEKEDENLQLLYYLSYIVKSGINRVPNHWKLQICKWFPAAIISFEERSSFLHLIDLKNPLETPFFHVNQAQESCSLFKTNCLGGESFAYL